MWIFLQKRQIYNLASLTEELTLRGKNLLLEKICSSRSKFFPLTLLHSERPKLYTILAFWSAVGLKVDLVSKSYLIKRNTQKFMQTKISLFSEKRQGGLFEWLFIAINMV